MPHAPRVKLIELNLRDVGQLFNTMDPSPFDEKDLDHDAEEFITSWAREHPLRERIALRVHLERWPATDPLQIVTDGVHNYFDTRARMSSFELRRLLRLGRTSLLIGSLFLIACLIGRELIGEHAAGLAGYLRESLTIAGWVAMWRPMEIYLYDWWPIRDRRRHFARLASMPIEVVRRNPAAASITG